MNKFTKTLFGAALAATMLFSVPAAQEAQAGGVSFSPPATEFFFDRTGDAPTFTTWTAKFIDPIAAIDKLETRGRLVGDTQVYTQVTYMSFDVSGSFFADPLVKGSGALSLFIDDVSILPPVDALGDPLVGGPFDSNLHLYRVDDASVLGVSPGDDVASGDAFPIALGDKLDSIYVDDSFDNDTATFEFDKFVSSGLVSGTPYLSFAIVADNNLSLLLPDQASVLVTPAPEPMSASYILLGSLAFAFRRIKSMLGLA